jgi:hypothetical protein
VESQLQDLLAQKEGLDVRLKDTESRMKELESQLQEEKFNRLYQLLGMLLVNLSSIRDMVCYAVKGHRTEPLVAVHFEVLIPLFIDAQLIS